MNFKSIVACVLLGLGCSSMNFAVLVKMPSAGELKERLKGFGDFTEKTGIDQALANQEKKPLGVFQSLNLAIADYEAKTSRFAAFMVEMNKPFILEALLQDSPEALKDLEGHGLYKPAQ